MDEEELELMALHTKIEFLVFILLGLYTVALIIGVAWNQLSIPQDASTDIRPEPPEKNSLLDREGMAKIYNFDSDYLGSIPDGWSIIKGSWHLVSEGNSPPNSYRQNTVRPGLDFVTLEEGIYNWQNGVDLHYKARSENTGCGGRQSFGMRFLYQDELNYYAVRRDDNGCADNYIHILRVVGGREQSLASINPGGTTVNTWRDYSIKVSTDGSTVTINVNLDGWETSVRDFTIWTSGKIGLYSTAQGPSTARVSFDDISIKGGS